MKNILLLFHLKSVGGICDYPPVPLVPTALYCDAQVEKESYVFTPGSGKNNSSPLPVTKEVFILSGQYMKHGRAEVQFIIAKLGSSNMYARHHNPLLI